MFRYAIQGTGVILYSFDTLIYVGGGGKFVNPLSDRFQVKKTYILAKKRNFWGKLINYSWAHE